MCASPRRSPPHAAGGHLSDRSPLHTENAEGPEFMALNPATGKDLEGRYSGVCPLRSDDLRHSHSASRSLREQVHVHPVGLCLLTASWLPPLPCLIPHHQRGFPGITCQTDSLRSIPTVKVSFGQNPP